MLSLILIKFSQLIPQENIIVEICLENFWGGSRGLKLYKKNSEYYKWEAVLHNQGIGILVTYFWVSLTFNLFQGSQICQMWHILNQNCSDDSTEVTEGVTLTPEIFGNKQGATSTPEIFGNKHSFVLTFFTTNTIYVNCKRFANPVSTKKFTSTS